MMSTMIMIDIASGIESNRLCCFESIRQSIVARIDSYIDIFIPLLLFVVSLIVKCFIMKLNHV